MSPEQERNPAVAADMSRIFGATAAPAPRDAAASRTRARKLAPAGGAKRRSAPARRAAIAMAAMLAFVAGAWALTREFAAPRTSTAGPVADRQAVPPVADPEPVVTFPAGPQTRADPVVAAQAGEPLSAAPEPETTATAATGPRTTPSPKAAATRRSPRSGTSATPAARRQAERRETRSARALGINCPPGSTDDRCIYRDVLDAHRRLDDTYNRARQAGHDYRELRQVRRAWDRARAISLDEPDETIRRYNELNARLRRSTRAAEQEGARDTED